MNRPAALLKFIGKALLNAAGGELAGEFTVQLLPQVAKDAGSWWSDGRAEGERRAEVEALVQAPAEEIGQLVAKIVDEIAADQPAAVRRTLAGYLNQVPATIRHSLRRPEDPTGTTLPPRLPLKQDEDLLMFLPTRLPRFKPGDVP